MAGRIRAIFLRHLSESLSTLSATVVIYGAKCLKTQCRIYFQNRFAIVALDTVKLELLALHLGQMPQALETKFVVQRWLGLAVRNRFGHIANDHDPVEEWATLCLHDALIMGVKPLRFVPKKQPVAPP